MPTPTCVCLKGLYGLVALYELVCVTDFYLSPSFRRSIVILIAKPKRRKIEKYIYTERVLEVLNNLFKEVDFLLKKKRILRVLKLLFVLKF